jgi:anti-sigma regulatory factor (Ser/Thr protein kinase)
VRVIRECADYLGRLASGLRLFALDPEKGDSGEAVDLEAWWIEVRPFIQNALPKQIQFDSNFEPSLPPVSINRAGLTQAIFNLVQNAGEALKNQDQGSVQISCEYQQDVDQVVIRVIDSGPGMSPDIQRHCLEPFFTTKTRTLSTGLGLALVHNVVRQAGGRLDLQSTPGNGTTVSISLRVAKVESESQLPKPRITLSLTNGHRRAFVARLLQDLGCEIDPQDAASSESPVSSMWILDREADSGRLEQFLETEPSRRALVFCDAERPDAPHEPHIPHWSNRTTAQRVVRVPQSAKPSEVRSYLKELLR